MKIARNRWVCSIAFALMTTLEANALELTSSDVHPETYPTVQAVKHMGTVVSEKTNGKITIKVAPSGKMGSEPNTIDMVRRGEIAIARVSLAQFSEQVPEVTVMSLPFIFRNVFHMRKVIDGPLAKDIAKPFEEHGFVVLAFYDSGARSLYTVGRPVQKLQDMKGLKFRVQKAGVMEEMITSLGGSALVVPYNEVANALKTKAVDGAENNWASFVTSGHYETARYMTLTEHSMLPEVLVMSKKIWDVLEPKDQQALLLAARESTVYMRKLWDETELKSKEQARKSGVEIATLLSYDRSQFVQAVGPLHKKVLVTDRMRDFAQRIRQTYY